MSYTLYLIFSLFWKRHNLALNMPTWGLPSHYFNISTCQSRTPSSHHFWSRAQLLCTCKTTQPLPTSSAESKTLVLTDSYSHCESSHLSWGHITTTKSVLIKCLTFAQSSSSWICKKYKAIFRNIAKYSSTAIPWGAKHIAYIQVIMVSSFLDIIYHFDG